MKIIKNIYKSIFSPLQIFYGKDAGCKLFGSTIVVVAAALLGAVIFPLLYYFNFRSKFDISISADSMLMMLSVGILTWLAVCMLFWLLSKSFRKPVSFKEIASTWGYSYIPNVICIMIYNLILLKTNLFTSNDILGFIINTLFIMLLIWKVIYFFIELKYVINTNGAELLIATLIAGVFFILLMWAGFLAGIQVPML